MYEENEKKISLFLERVGRWLLVLLVLIILGAWVVLFVWMLFEVVKFVGIFLLGFALFCCYFCCFLGLVFWFYPWIVGLLKKNKS